MQELVIGDSSTISFLEAIRLFQSLDVETLIFPVLIQLGIILVVARLFGLLFRQFGQPAVVGEIFAGIVLGPSLFGWLFPEWWQWLFRPSLIGENGPIPQELADSFLPRIFAVLSQLGLIFLLFLIGLEFEFHHLRDRSRAATAISISGIVLPFASGMLVASLIFDPLGLAPEKRLGFTLFMGTALSITAVPVLGRIMMELGITKTRLATVTIAAAAVEDALGWIILATVTSLERSRDPSHPEATFSFLLMLKMLAYTITFVLVMILLVRPLLVRWLSRSFRSDQGQLSGAALTVIIVLMFLCAMITNRIGIFAIFGPFILGAILSDQTTIREAIQAKLQDMVTVFFLPIFFVYTGLRTSIQALENLDLWLMCGLILAAAIGSKLIGCGVAAYLTGFNRKESFVIGSMMNARGLIELVVINLGRDLGVIPESVFAMLVIMALTTTFITTPLIKWNQKGTELERIDLSNRGKVNQGGDNKIVSDDENRG
jgi:Kef-type K+ transport system membrane component KefB